MDNNDLYFDEVNDISSTSLITNFLSEIDDSVKLRTVKTGNRINAYYLPEFGNNLIRISVVSIVA